jgi:signal transduction histidine kinase/ActR/RegA family two-component response regulator
MFRNGITPENYQRYLRGHTLISGATGLVWSCLAITYLDPSSTLNLFIAVNIVVSIALGGMLPSAEYRPTFISLSTGMFLPFSFFWLLTVEGPTRLIGVGLLILYGFGLLVSARSELQTIETLAAERNRRLNDQLQKQNRQIEKASAEKSRFLAATSHDMSQPLQAQGFFIRAMKETVTTTEQIDLLAKIEATWRSQKDMLQALVETARLSSGAIIARTSVFDVDDILSELEADFAEPAREKSLILSISRGSIAVESDRVLVARILRNLLANAVKFTPRGGRVIVETHEHNDGILIEVSDNGPGINETDQARIFDEYVQLNEGGRPQGLGLGLPIVRQLAEKLDIPLQFKSQPGWGTRVGITLPAASSAPGKTTTKPTEAHMGGVPLILVIDDEATVRESLAMLLTQWGCRVIAAGSGREAKRILSWANEVPAFIIADKRLSNDEDGIDVIAALRDEVLEDIPAVLLTGEVYDFTKVAELEHLTIIPKPADSEILRAALDRALETRATD